MQGNLGGKAAALVALFAALQMVVHMVYFLHLTPKTEGGWSIMKHPYTT